MLKVLRLSYIILILLPLLFSSKHVQQLDEGGGSVSDIDRIRAGDINLDPHGPKGQM